jgi:hypothetical protein
MEPAFQSGSIAAPAWQSIGCVAGQEKKWQPATTGDLRHQFGRFIAKPEVENGRIELSQPRDSDRFLQGACFGDDFATQLLQCVADLSTDVRISAASSMRVRPCSVSLA